MDEVVLVCVCKYARDLYHEAEEAAGVELWYLVQLRDVPHIELLNQLIHILGNLDFFMELSRTKVRECSRTVIAHRIEGQQHLRAVQVLARLAFLAAFVAVRVLRANLLHFLQLFLQSLIVRP